VFADVRPGESITALLLHTRYPVLIALMLMLHNTVKTTGEYLLGHELSASGRHPETAA